MIGVDFDNTIVCYDRVFGRVAVEQGLVPPHAATSKTAIRDHLRSVGQEDRWTELQGTIYGPRMMDAAPFPGVVEFFSACRASGIPVAIVSHRTRFPYLGERHDLHVAARDWLARHGFHAADRLGLPESRVFFEETKEAKLARIAELGCTHFIDDLPELLVHPLFPAGARRILFDPRGEHAALPGVEPASSWDQLARSLIPAIPPLGEAGRRAGAGAGSTARAEAPSPRPSPAGRRGEDDGPPRTSAGGNGGEDDQRLQAGCASLLAAAGLSPAVSFERLTEGGNNRVYRVETVSGPVLLKEYFRHAADLRDRLGAEQAFSQFAWRHGVSSLPRPLGCDRETGLGLYEFVVGRKLAPGEVTAAHVDAAAAFFAAVNRHRRDPAAADLPIASEACFSPAEHLACIDRRMARLATIEPGSDQHRRAAALVAHRLLPAWHRVRADVAAAGMPLDEPLATDVRAISPSDFGFHNCLVTDAGLTFIDFEYAGWDDPAKTVCDFFCQPAVPVPRDHVERFLNAATAVVGDPGLGDRVALLLPVYELKWCCIMLNEFLPTDDRRRAFAGGADDAESRRARQLDKVDRTLAGLLTRSSSASATPRTPRW